MAEWDRWREYIAGGGTGSWPRDAFESLLDEHDEELERLRDVIKNYLKAYDAYFEGITLLNTPLHNRRFLLEDFCKNKAAMLAEVEAGRADLGSCCGATIKSYFKFCPVCGVPILPDTSQSADLTKCSCGDIILDKN